MNINEIKFFRYMIKNIDYKTITYNTAFTTLSIEKLLDKFSKLSNIDREELILYLKEWDRNKFFEYNEDYEKKGYFYDLDNLILFKFKGEYSDIIPDTVIRKYTLKYISNISKSL